MGKKGQGDIPFEFYKKILEFEVKRCLLLIAFPQHY